MTLPRRACHPTRATAPDPPPDVRGLRAYQAEGVRWLRARAAAGRPALLGDDMGLGKTCQALRALPRRARAIVVCPASVSIVWAEEARRWRPDLRAGPWGGRAPREGEVAIASYDSLPDAGRGATLVGEDLSGAILVLDEAHRVKEASARRTQRVRRLRAQCRSTWGLTGTPMTGTPDDLAGLLASLGLFGEAFPGGEEEYDRLCGTTREIVRGRAVPSWGEIGPEVSRRLRGVMLRRTRGDHLDLPPARWVDVPCAAPADLRDHLDELTEAWDRYDPEELPPFELYSAATAALARSRAGAARDLALDVSRARPTLVFSAHVDPILEVCKIPGAVRILGEDGDEDRRAAVEAFSSGRSRVLAATIGAGGVGLNLQAAGAVILVDESFTPSDTDQAVARAWRQGQRHEDVLVYRMASDHPLDRRIRAIQDRKRGMIAAAVG